MNYIKFIIFIYTIIILLIKGDELSEEIVYPGDTLVNTEKQEENVDMFRICQEGLGCIETDQTWYHQVYRPVNLRPLDRTIMKTDFLLIKRDKKDNETLLYTNFQAKAEMIKKAGFNKESELMILIHDFTANGYTGWIKHLSYKVFSHALDMNLISVDWQRGAEPPYDQAIANARAVALEIIVLLRELKEKLKYSLDDIHIVGHGVGAHIAGYVGSTYNKIKKITGLDPSGPRFQGMPPNVKLNPRCARYVEVIHTDHYQYRSQGINETLGHSDFFVNGERKQPGCTENTTFGDLISIARGSLKEGEILPGCSHKRAFKYFIESISNTRCTFQGIRCNSIEDFENGKCTTCNIPDHDCRLFGLKSYLETSENNKFFLNTDSHAPFCMLEYSISVYVKNPEKFGYFDFILINENGDVTEAHLSADNKLNHRALKGGTDNANTFVYFANPPKLHKIREAKVRWNENKKIYCVFYCKQTINVTKISIRFLGTGSDDASEEYSFCPITRFVEIENGEYVTFKRCLEKTEPTNFSTKKLNTTTTPSLPDHTKPEEVTWSVFFKSISNNSSSNIPHKNRVPELFTEPGNTMIGPKLARNKFEEKIGVRSQSEISTLTGSSTLSAIENELELTTCQASEDNISDTTDLTEDRSWILTTTGNQNNTFIETKLESQTQPSIPNHISEIYEDTEKTENIYNLLLMPASLKSQSPQIVLKHHHGQISTKAESETVLKSLDKETETELEMTAETQPNYLLENPAPTNKVLLGIVTDNPAVIDDSTFVPQPIKQKNNDRVLSLIPIQNQAGVFDSKTQPKYITSNQPQASIKPVTEYPNTNSNFAFAKIETQNPITLMEPKLVPVQFENARHPDIFYATKNTNQPKTFVKNNIALENGSGYLIKDPSSKVLKILLEPKVERHPEFWLQTANPTNFAALLSGLSSVAIPNSDLLLTDTAVIQANDLRQNQMAIRTNDDIHTSTNNVNKILPRLEISTTKTEEHKYSISPENAGNGNVINISPIFEKFSLISRDVSKSTVNMNPVPTETVSQNPEILVKHQVIQPKNLVRNKIFQPVAENIKTNHARLSSKNTPKTYLQPHSEPQTKTSIQNVKRIGLDIYQNRRILLEPKMEKQPKSFVEKNIPLEINSENESAPKIRNQISLRTEFEKPQVFVVSKTENVPNSDDMNNIQQDEYFVSNIKQTTEPEHVIENLEPLTGRINLYTASNDLEPRYTTKRTTYVLEAKITLHNTSKMPAITTSKILNEMLSNTLFPYEETQKNSHNNTSG